MDTTDPNIVFDENGVCNHCTEAIERLKQPPYGLPPAEKEKALQELIEKIKTAGKGKQYDCLIGLSGGVDSSYLAYLVKQWGLKPFAIHLDNGWNSDIGTKNIENLCKILDIELHTITPDWEEFKDLQLAFLNASTPDSEIPSDNILAEVLYRTADKHNIKFILSGCNITSESILPQAWSQGHRDGKYVTSVYKKYGKKRKLSIPTLSTYQVYLYHKLKGMHWIDTLDYVQYDKEQAKEYLKQHFNWQDYGRKHGESIYTRIYQEYILPQKFGYDKRRAHYSSLIVADQLSRQEALEMLKVPLYTNSTDLDNDLDYFCNKLEITRENFEKIMALPIKSINDYPNESKTFRNKLWKLAKFFFKRKK
jgi:N-acetyl sugar amidotransferase